jgi:anti-sigma factor RsiW
MSEHVTAEEVRRFCEGRLQDVDVLRVARHLSACPSCAAHEKPKGEPGLDGVALRFRAAVLGEASHLDPDEDLFPWVDGTLDPSRRLEVAEHLEVCERCREDAMAASAESRAQHKTRRFPLAIAAAVFLAFFAGLIAIALRNSGPKNNPRSVSTIHPVPATRNGSTPSPAARVVDPRVAAAIQRGAFDFPPALAELRAEPDVLRGKVEKAHTVPLSPAATFVETATPIFSWTAPPAEVGEVIVMDGDREIARGLPTARRVWTPPRALPRQTTLTWQVRMHRADGSTYVIPRVPDAPPMFRILDAATADRIAGERRLHADDPLLLGVLEAQAGLIDDARRDLARAAAKDAAARALAASIPPRP